MWTVNSVVVTILGFQLYDTCKESENHLYEVLLVLVQFVCPVVSVETQINFFDLWQHTKAKYKRGLDAVAPGMSLKKINKLL